MTENAIQEHAEKGYQRLRIKRNSSIPTKLITVLCNLGQDRQVCLTTEAGADITKSYSVICMRKNLIQKLKGKFWEKMGSDLG